MISRQKQNKNKMKAKLLKKLRKKFYIEYYPILKQYKVCGGEETYHHSLDSAKTRNECNIINHGRKYYEKYAKHFCV